MPPGSCWRYIQAPPNRALANADTVELRLQRGKAPGEALCLRWTAGGSAPEGVSACVQKDGARWDVEARIPLGPLPSAREKGAALMADLRRCCPVDAGVENSRLLPRAPKDASSFVPVRWTSDCRFPSLEPLRHSTRPQHPTLTRTGA